MAVVALVGVVAFVVWRLYEAEQLTYEKWEVFVTPYYIRALLVDGLLTTLQMAVTAILFATVFGLVFGVGKLSDHRVHPVALLGGGGVLPGGPGAPPDGPGLVLDRHRARRGLLLGRRASP